MFFQRSIACVVAAALLAATQTILSDPGTAGPEVEIVHLYQDEWPTGELLSIGHIFIYS